MGTTECSQPASKSSWDSQDFGDISMVLKMAHFRKSTGPRWVNNNTDRKLEVAEVYTVKWKKYHYPDEIFIPGCTECCQN